METPTDDTGVAGPVFWTIGHSDHPIDRFVALLRAAEITAVADLRSVPWSRRHPQFGARTLAAVTVSVMSGQGA